MPTTRPALAEAVQRARQARVVIVAAAPQPHARWLPGALPRVVRVNVDWTLPRETCRLQLVLPDDVEMWASGFPRPIPGVPAERNLKGVSFAVANATGLLARVLAGGIDDAAAVDDYLAAALGRVLAVENGTRPSS